MDSCATMPANKLLLLFPENTSKNDMGLILTDIFGQNSLFGEPIVRDIIWETKYYTTKVDLYVDQYEEFSSWCTEFADDECYELRNHISGIIVFFTVDKLAENIKNFQAAIETIPSNEEKFYIGCNLTQCCSSEISLENINVGLLTENLEIVNWNNEDDENLEKEGLERIKEIIDIHPWKNVENVLNKREAYTMCSNEITRTAVELTSLRSRLQEARNEYHSLLSEQEQADYLTSVVDEISELLI